MTELVMQNLAQQETNEIPANGKKNKKAKVDKETAAVARPCAADGTRDLCDDLICHFDGECRSGCCSQVLGKGYSRCAAMLVGDYCPRALDPIGEMLEAERELEAAKHALDVEEPVAVIDPASELPCNVFGTVDRCDGMACEHDGNCFSGCCSMFVNGEAKRCMPLVNGDMCPIAIDVVEH